MQNENNLNGITEIDQPLRLNDNRQINCDTKDSKLLKRHFLNTPLLLTSTDFECLRIFLIIYLVLNSD